MYELNPNECVQVNGGIIPLVLAVVAADISLIGSMVGAGYWKIK
ncbi:class IIb bacteriocin, lactobin A/cerein 7B family [Alteromonas sp. 14N.309.X.WAT.G.H12]